MKKPLLRVTITFEDKQEIETLKELAKKNGWSIAQLLRRKALNL